MLNFFSISSNEILKADNNNTNTSSETEKDFFIIKSEYGCHNPYSVHGCLKSRERKQITQDKISTKRRKNLKQILLLRLFKSQVRNRLLSVYIQNLG